MKQSIQIRLDQEQLELLDSLSLKSGHSLAALVRWCVTKSLPRLAENIDHNLRTQVPNESTIDTKPGV